MRELSGGERARLILARVLSRPANLLVLDEPTNDLDIETLDLLQELVAGFSGTVILVSHDRDFLDRTVTSIIAPDGGGRWIEYAGGYSDMLAQRGGTKLDDQKSRRQEPRRVRQRDSACRPRRRRRKKALLQAEIRARKPAEEDGGGIGRDLRRWRTTSPIPPSTSATPPRSRRRSPRSTRNAPTSPAMEEEWLELEMLREELEG